jgi:hypothetical protein
LSLFNEKRLAKYPLMPFAVFKSSSNNATFLVAIGHTIGIEYYLPLYFQSVEQSSPLRSGLLILPLMVTESIVDILVGIAIHRTGRYREIIWVGVAFMTLGTGLYIQLQTHTAIATIISFQIIGGIGVACLFQAPMMAVQNTVSQADTAGATATLGFFRNLAASFSIVLGGVAFQNSMASRHSTLAAAGIGESVLNILTSSQAAANLQVVKTIGNGAQRLAIKDAFAWSIRNMFVMYTGVTAVALVASVAVKQYHMSKEHMETKTEVKHLTERKKEK